MRTSPVAFLLGTLLASTSALSAQITAGPSTQSITFSGDAATGFTITAPQLDMPGFDTTNTGLGGAWILSLDLTTGPEVGGFFPVNPNNETFKYIATDSDTVIETLHVSKIQDDTTQPKFYFDGDAPSTITGDSAFVTAFSNVDAGDWIMNDIGVTLTGLVGSASATLSSLEKVPSTPTSVPEPAMLITIAGLFFGLDWLNRRRKPMPTKTLDAPV